MENSSPKRLDFMVAAAIAVLVVLVIGTALIASTAPQPAAFAPQPFTGGSRIAYLGPTRGPYNIYLVHPSVPEAPPEQVTFSQFGVFDFDVSHDGRYIAYAEQVSHPDAPSLQGASNRLPEIFILDVQTRQTRQLTDCWSADAYCTTPAFRPDGTVIAFQRSDLNTALGIAASPPRLWLAEVATGAMYPVFEDTQILGTEPRWSQDGNRLVFYDANSESVMVRDYAATDPAKQLISIPAGNGAGGTLSPDGNKLVFPELLAGGTNSLPRAVLRMANLATGQEDALTTETDLTDDNGPVWHPDGVLVAFGRVYLERGRQTRGFQIYVYNTQSATLSPLLVDANYQNSSLVWSPDGALLAVSRFKVTDASATTTPEIWTVTLDGKATKVVADGFYPRWVR